MIPGFDGIRTRPIEAKPPITFERIRTRPLQIPQEEPEVPADMEPSHLPFQHQPQPLQNLPQRTAGAFTEGLAQSANQMVAAPLLNLAGGAVQGIGYLGGKISPEFEQGAENLAQKAYQARDYYQQPVDLFNNAPEDTLANISKKTGEMFLPIPGGAAVKGTQAATKAFPHLTKDIGQAVGAGTALETLKDVPVTGVEGIDDLLKSVAGMALANKAMSPGKVKMIAALDKTAQEAIEKMPIDEKILGRVFSLGAKPQKEILDSAKKHRVSLPANIKLNSPWSHFLANNVYKSFLTSAAWKNVIENSDKSVVNAWEENINKIHPTHIAPDTANLEYEKALKSEENRLKEESKKIYNWRDEAIKDTDKVIPKKALENIREVAAKRNVAALSDPSRKVMEVVDKILKRYIPSTKLSKKFRPSNELDDTNLQKQVAEKLKYMPNSVPLIEFTNQISELGEMTRKGAPETIRFIKKGFIEDVNSVAHLNTEFHKRNIVANTFYKNEVGNTIKTDMARSMLTGQRPKEALQYMNSPRDVKKLSDILGNFPQKQEVMSGLKRAKFQSVITDKITNKDGTINYANLSGMFEKRSELQPLLKELSGENYESLKRLANVCQAITKGGRQLANFSGTAHTTADLKRVGQLFDAVMGLGAAAAAGAGSVTGVGAAVAGAATPYVLSKLMANQRYVDAAVQYAFARQRNNIQKALQYQRSMETIFEKEILAKTPLVNQKEE